MRQRRRMLGAFQRAVEIAQRLRRVGREPSLGEIDAADDDGEHIVEVMREAAGQLADRLHLLRLPQLLGEMLALRRFRGERRIDIAQLRLRGGDLVEPAAQQADRRGADENGDGDGESRSRAQHRAVLVHDMRLRIDHLLLMRGFGVEAVAQALHDLLAGALAHYSHGLVVLSCGLQLHRMAQLGELGGRQRAQSLQRIASFTRLGRAGQDVEIRADSFRRGVERAEIGVVIGQQIATLRRFRPLQVIEDAVLDLPLADQLSHVAIIGRLLADESEGGEQRGRENGEARIEER